MGKRSRRTGARRERELTALLPGAERTARTGYPGPDLKWLGRWIEAKYRQDGFRMLYRWLDDDASILAVRAARRPWLVVMELDELLDLLDEGGY